MGKTGRGDERREWVKEEETGGKVPIWQRGQECGRHSYLEKANNRLLGAGNWKKALLHV